MLRLASASMVALLFICGSAFAIANNDGSEPYKRITAPGSTLKEPHFRHHWQVGQELPMPWRHGHDAGWRSHHLHRPAKGTHWVDAGDEYVRVRNSNDTILEIRISH